MSEVNADGMLINPHQHILREVQHLTNSLMADEPEHQDEEPQRVRGGWTDRGPAGGEVGGLPHMPAKAFEKEKKKREK